MGGSCSKPVHLVKNVEVVRITRRDKDSPFYKATVRLHGTEVEMSYVIDHPERYKTGDLVNVWVDTESGIPTVIEGDTDRVGRTRGGRIVVGLNQCKSGDRAQTIVQWTWQLVMLAVLILTWFDVIHPGIIMLLTCVITCVLCLVVPKYLQRYYATHVFDETVVSKVP